jgi:FdhE protein
MSDAEADVLGIYAEIFRAAEILPENLGLKPLPLPAPGERVEPLFDRRHLLPGVEAVEAALGEILLVLSRVLRGRSGDVLEMGERLARSPAAIESLAAAAAVQDGRGFVAAVTDLGLDPALAAMAVRETIRPLVETRARRAVNEAARRPEDPPADRCPVCGSMPTMRELWQKARTPPSLALRCSFCAAAWPYPDARCSFCGRTPAALRAVGAQGLAGARASACTKCRNYIKEVEAPAGGHDSHELVIVNLTTAAVDIKALSMGYTSPLAEVFSLV